MIPTMILLFVVGYLFIALEHKTRIDKSAVTLLMAGAIWTVFSLLGNDPHIQHELVDQLGDTCEILVFLIGAMTIVDLIDSYGGFNVITDHITTRNKRKLMWLLAIITFFMSAALDNMTTTIIMVMLWLYFCMWLLFMGAEINCYLEQPEKFSKDAIEKGL